jgi:hypothetical protein
MTKDEKYKAIVERAGVKDWCNDPTFISVMVIVHYLDQLKEYGLIDAAYVMTDAGNRIVAVCEEFDWKPSNDDIAKFADEMVDAPERAAIEYMIRRYRDDKDGLLKEMNDIDKPQDLNKKPKKAKKKRGKK